MTPFHPVKPTLNALEELMSFPYYSINLLYTSIFVILLCVFVGRFCRAFRIKEMTKVYIFFLILQFFYPKNQYANKIEVIIPTKSAKSIAPTV